MPFNEDGSRKSVMYKRSGFKMKGSAFYGKGNQSPVSQIGGLPEKVAPVRPAASAPAAPSAAGLDYVNPVEGSSPASQRLARHSDASSQAATNKAEMQAVRTAQGGPTEGEYIEPQPYTPTNPGSTGTSSGGPGGGPGPMAQVAPKTGVKDVDKVTSNKMESYAARAAKGGPTENTSPMEQKQKSDKTKVEEGKDGMSTTTTRYKEKSDDKSGNFKTKTYSATDKKGFINSDDARTTSKSKQKKNKNVYKEKTVTYTKDGSGRVTKTTDKTKKNYKKNTTDESSKSRTAKNKLSNYLMKQQMKLQEKKAEKYKKENS